MRAIRFLVALTLSVLFASSVAYADNITVYSNGSVAIGETRKLTAYVPLSPDSVNWTVNGIAGGNTTVGTVSTTGLYTAPAVVPANPAVTVTATSTAYPAKFGSVTLTITQMPVQLWSVSPTSAPPGQVTISLNGAAFTDKSVVSFADAPVPTTYVSSTKLKVTVTTTAVQAGTKLGVKVSNPGLGGTVSGSVAFAVTLSDSGSTTPPPPTPPPTTTPPTTTPAVTVGLTPAAANVVPFGTVQFSATVTGSTNQSVTYSVNGTNGGNSSVGTISGSGLYTAPAAGSGPLTVTVRATSAASGSASASATVTVSGQPDPGKGKGTPNLAAARLLEQATFGPTPDAIAKVKMMGVDGWLNDQFAKPESDIPNPGAMNSSQLKAQYVAFLSQADDQLRQRVAFALAQIIVISMNKNIYPDEIVPYLQILSHDAFGNYRTLIGDISTSSQMGKYLDIANSNKPAPNSGANENYARELMQLFTIGLVQLNPDGTPKLDAGGKTIPTYDQTTVQQIALAFTGWTYPGTRTNNWEDFSGPLQPKDVNHDMRQKSFLGCTLPANQTTVADMNGTLDCIFQQPNVAPFVVTRLIRYLVTSNPSPAYIQRVAAVFNDNGSGVKGDLKATVKAILTDPEARDDTAGGSVGHLRDPILHVTSFVRANGGYVRTGNQIPWQMSQLAQEPLTPPSVFGFYSPLYRIPQSSTFGPEFQIYSPTEAVLRGNLLWQIITNPGSDFAFDIAPFVAASTLPELIDLVDQTFLYGRMPQAMRQSIANAVVAQQDATSRAQVAVYLTALSGLYAVQH